MTTDAEYLTALADELMHPCLEAGETTSLILEA